MANVSVYNMEGKEVGTMELNDAVFGVEIGSSEMGMRSLSIQITSCRPPLKVHLNTRAYPAPP